MSGAFIAWRNYCDWPFLGSPWTLDDADDEPGEPGSYTNLLSPIRRRIWTGPADPVDGGDNSLQFAWSSGSTNRSLRLVGLLDAVFASGDSGTVMRYLNSSGSVVTIESYSSQGNFYDGEARHWLMPLASAVTARGVNLKWDGGVTDTVSASRLWASSALVLEHGLRVQTIRDTYRTVGGDTRTPGGTLWRDSTARTLRRLSVTLDGPNVDAAAIWGTESDEDAPFVMDLAGRGIGADILIMPVSLVGGPVARRRAVYGTIASDVQIAPRSGGLFTVRFEVQEI